MNSNKLRKPTEDVSVFVARREMALQKLGRSALIVASHPELVRNHDVHFAYRQDSNLYYLTGFEEPESILILRPGQSPSTVMFVREKNVERETWDGFRFGPEATQSEFKIDKVYKYEEFETVAPELLKGYEDLYYRLYKNEEMDHKIKNVLLTVKQLFGRSGYGLMSVKDADTFLGEMRLIKHDADLKNLRKACELSALAHVEAMKFTKPGVTERQVEGVLSYHFLMGGSARPGYNSIVAAGANATTLHYVFNDQVCEEGDLLLIDAGCEYNYFTGDITRTFPVSGRFTPAQKKVYEGVLKVQKQIIESIKPGLFFKDLHELGASLLVDLMLELGLVHGRKEDIIQSNEHRKYYPHGIGHWLGMDVHDSGLYMVKGEPRPLEPGMVFTIEPGLYIPAQDYSAPEELRGIGIRIEDNILVTAHGYENLTASVPKEVKDIEELMQKNRS